ncbi:MAG: hypothetical protein R3E10_12785 [Gemmatimonadota bacterium]
MPNPAEPRPTLELHASRVRRRFRALLEEGAHLRPAGRARRSLGAFLERYVPRFALELFDTTFYLTGFRYDEALGFFVGYVVPPATEGQGPREVFPRIFYKDSSLLWRVATHYVHDHMEYWIGKGDTRWIQVGDDEILCSAEETTNLPYEMQASLDTCSRAVRKRRDDDAIELVLRRAPSGRIEPYADFLAPRRAALVQINAGRPIARFTSLGDPTSLVFEPGFEPDLTSGVADQNVTQSVFFGGELFKYRVLSVNRAAQYMFFASPTRAWMSPPQATTRELSSYGVRLVDVDAPEELSVPAYEYHEVDEDGTVTHTQIPDGFAGDPHPLDPHRADASRWVEQLPVIQAFRRLVLRRGPRRRTP